MIAVIDVPVGEKVPDVNAEEKSRGNNMKSDSDALWEFEGGNEESESDWNIVHQSRGSKKAKPKELFDVKVVSMKSIYHLCLYHR